MKPFQVKDKINLTQKEKQIFELLIEVIRHFGLETKLRVAGGWVRDKLLGQESNDIDTAIDNMLGREFCEKIKEYLLYIGEEGKHDFTVIPSNPAQSKHLETAKMHLFGVEIDFTNLRSEEYCENSRIPTMMFGSAKKDAERRDLTINSLFYNIHTDSVEDFTGRGLADLKLGRIVTPLDATKTFLDDPLRVLRAIRFVSRFGFVLDEELQKAAASRDVKTAIVAKISRERIGSEIDLIISGNEPVKAMDYICEMELFWDVFTLPPACERSNIEGFDRFCVACLNAAWSILQLVGFSTFDEEQRRLYLYGALFLPLRRIEYKYKAKGVPIAHIFRNSLKRRGSDAEMVISLHLASEEFLALIPFITSNEIDHLEKNSERKSLHVSVTSRQRIMAGMLLREIKSFWRLSLLISILISTSDSSYAEAFLKTSADLDKILQLYRTVENVIIELGLDNVWEMKPLVNGKDIMRVLNLKDGDRLVGEWKEKSIEWQLANPSGIVEECLDWIRQEFTRKTRPGCEDREQNQKEKRNRSSRPDSGQDFL